MTVTSFRERLKYSGRYQKCRRAFLKFPYFRSYFKYQYLAVYTPGRVGRADGGSREEGEGVRARIRAEYRKRFVGGGCDRRRGRERVQEAEEVTEKRRRRVRRNVRASRHQRTLRLHPIPRFYSLIPLCSPPGSQGDFYSSLRISTLTSRHPQPSLPRPPAPSPTSRSFSPFRPAFLLFLFLSLSLFSPPLPFRSSFSFSSLAHSLALSSYPLVPLQVVAATPSPGTSSPVIRSAPFVTLSATATKAHSLVRISSAVDTSQHRLKNRVYRSPRQVREYTDRQVRVDGAMPGLSRLISVAWSRFMTLRSLHACTGSLINGT